MDIRAHKSLRLLLELQMEGNEAYRMSQQAASCGLRPVADGPCVRGPKMAQAGACCGTEETRLSTEPAAEGNS
jgi:hypothetical protein